MMSRLCLLAALLCLPLGCFGGLNECRDEINDDPLIGPPLDGVNNYKAYKFQADTLGDCNDLTLTCHATVIPDVNLIGRTWFITNIRPHFGFYYDNNVIQDFRVQCPRGTFLHLFVQNSNLPPADACTGVDFVRIQATGLEPNGEVTFCGDNDDVAGEAEIYNNGLGRIFADGQANISFCSNNVIEDPNVRFDGFVIRATCLNPAEFSLPGCVDLSFFRVWDPEFTNLINMPLDEPDRIQLPHRKKRMAPRRGAKWALKNLHREKKFVDTQEGKILLTSADTVNYFEGVLTIFFANGTTRVIPPRISCFVTVSQLIGTRLFFYSSDFDFPGEGELNYAGSFASLTYTIAPENLESFFLPSPLNMEAANIIYNYIYENYIFPYPVIDTEGPGTATIYPLPSANNPPKFEELDIPGYRPIHSFGFIQEDIQTGSCRRAMRIELTPSNKARLPKELTRYCAFFEKSCDLTLRVACRELNRLDPASVGK